MSCSKYFGKLTTLLRLTGREGMSAHSTVVVFIITMKNRNKKQKKYKAELDKVGAFSNPIVTEIKPFTVFYPAEDYHQQYFENNEGSNPYCTVVIRPKVDKFRKVFKDKLKK